MSKPPILLVGSGGHARSCIDVLEQEGRYSIVGLVGLPVEVGSKVLGFPVLGTDKALKLLKDECSNALIAVGQIKTPDVRMRLFAQLLELGFTLPTVVSPRAYVSPHAQIGAGSIVMHGALVNAGARIGRNCIVNCQSLIEHDSVIGDHCHISTGAIVNGGVTVGIGTFLGSGAVLREGITLGMGCIVGMCVPVRRSHRDHSKVLKAG